MLYDSKPFLHSTISCEADDEKDSWKYKRKCTVKGEALKVEVQALK